MSEVILRVENVSKEYRLGVIGTTTLREEIQRWMAKLKHQEDPTSIIGKSRTNKSGMFMALDDISFEVNKGEAIGIIGENGAGKSTLLKLITRVTGPSNGRILLNGKVASLLEVGTGMHPELTGRENIYLNGTILGMSKEEIDKRMDSIIDFSECTDFIDTPVKRYSSGMKVKLGFAVAAHLDAEILIMDEVLAVGDINFQNKCISKMKELAQSGKTILYVSHNMSTIRNLCDRCLVLVKGKLVFNGKVETAIQRYVSAEMNDTISKDISKALRPYRTDQKTHMEYVEILDKDLLIYDMGETIKFKVKWSSKEDFNNLQFRIVIFKTNENAVASSFSNTFFGHKNCINENIVELDTSSLLPGKYSIELVMMELDEQGRFVKHDVLQYVINFQVQVSPDKPVYNSYNATWGYVNLPEAKVLEVTNE